MTKVNIEVPDQIHKEAKKKALDMGITLQAFIVNAVNQKVNER